MLLIVCQLLLSPALIYDQSRYLRHALINFDSIITSLGRDGHLIDIHCPVPLRIMSLHDAYCFITDNSTDTFWLRPL